MSDVQIGFLRNCFDPPDQCVIPSFHSKTDADCFPFEPYGHAVRFEGTSYLPVQRFVDNFPNVAIRLRQKPTQNGRLARRDRRADVHLFHVAPPMSSMMNHRSSADIYNGNTHKPPPFRHNLYLRVHSRLGQERMFLYLRAAVTVRHYLSPTLPTPPNRGQGVPWQAPPHPNTVRSPPPPKISFFSNYLLPQEKYTTQINNIVVK